VATDAGIANSDAGIESRRIVQLFPPIPCWLSTRHLNQRTDMSFESHSIHFIASDEPSSHILDEHNPAAAFPVSV